ncbi:MAG: energy transducer TonB [Thermodesulfovibrionales bacterium]
MIKKKHTKIENNSQGLGYMHEQRYGLITSLLIHSIVFILFFALSVHKNSDYIKTYYIQFTRIGEQTVQAAGPSREIIKSKVTKVIKKDIVQTRRKDEIKEEIPLIKETPVEEYEAIIKTDAIESHEAVNVASTSELGLQHQATLHQGGEGTVGNVSSAAPSGTSGVINTEFGSTGAPAFLKRQMPIYPVMARKLGKEGKVVLRLFINEKGRLLNVEVVEQAGYGFTESAVEAVKMSTFSPAHENGVNVASKALLTIRFVLKKE